MRSERLQRQIDRLLDQCEEAIGQRSWDVVDETAAAVLAVDPENADALAYRTMAERGRQASAGPTPAPSTVASGQSAGDAPPPSEPMSFGAGRYAVKRFLGEGGKKRVYLAHDGLLDRDVAFALIKTEGLVVQSEPRETRRAGRRTIDV